jgi:hypothetical protein
VRGNFLLIQLGQVGDLKTIFFPIPGGNMVIITGNVFGNLQGPINYPYFSRSKIL